MSARTRKFPIQSLLGRFRVPLAAGVACAAGIASAATGPENALLVVNADSWASTAIANEYIVTRRIPPPNVVRLRNLPSFEYMNVEDFRTKILGPLLRTAELRGIAPQLDCVIFSADFPWAIDVSADMAGKQFSKAISQPASITGLTYLYQFTMRKDPNYLGLNANFYCRQPLLTSIQAPWGEEDRNAYLAAIAALREKPAPPFKAPDKNLPFPPKLSTSPPSEESALQPILEKLTELRKRHPASTELHYNIACIQARLGNSDAAINALRSAVDNGWWDMRTAAADAREAREAREIRSRADDGLPRERRMAAERPVGRAGKGDPLHAFDGARLHERTREFRERSHRIAPAIGRCGRLAAKGDGLFHAEQRRALDDP